MALVVVLLSAGLLVPSAGAVSGEFRVLYVLATWGPATFGAAEVELVAAQTDEFFQASSSERFSMPGTVVGPVTLRRAAFERCDATSLRNDAPAALTAGYDRIAFVTPVVPSCRFAGKAEPTEVLLNGRLSVPLAVHELGHTLGLGHARSTRCIAAPTRSGCDVDETGDPFSPMGSGTLDFSAYEKFVLGWIPPQPYVTKRARYTLASPAVKTTLPHALIVQTEEGTWWIEYRPIVRGLVVRLVTERVGGRSPFAMGTILIANPTRAGRPWVAQGESYRIPASFRMTLERAGTARATVRFR